MSYKLYVPIYSTDVYKQTENKELAEKIIKKKIVRSGKETIVYSTDKKDHKIKMINKKPTEVKLDAKEISNREKSAEKAAIKAKR